MKIIEGDLKGIISKALEEWYELSDQNIVALNDDEFDNAIEYL